MKIGQYELANAVIAAPMAGVSDKPYRRVCRQHGAGMVVSEMVTSRLDLRKSTKSRFRLDLTGEAEPVVVQIVGTDPDMLAEAAQYNVDNGAQIIDINMGCPAKKVCKKAAGSALLANEPLVATILNTVVSSVSVPVTVKIRTGTNPEQRNAVNIAQIAEGAGVQAITIHGRTRECKFAGAIEYDTIAKVKQTISIPVIANGDIDSYQCAERVLKHTNADAVMIGRAAQGQPWLFKQIATYLETGGIIEPLNDCERITTITNHLQDIHEFYGERLGVKLARKHIKWYLQHWHTEIAPAVRTKITATENTQDQIRLIEDFLFSSSSTIAA